MYRTIIAFNDLQDNERSYRVGETFPRPGLRVSKARLEELSTNNNRMGYPLIKAVEGPEKAAEAEPKEMLAEAAKPAQKVRKSRKKE